MVSIHHRVWLTGPNECDEEKKNRIERKLGGQKVSCSAIKKKYEFLTFLKIIIYS